jgi:TolA-binding protein
MKKLFSLLLVTVTTNIFANQVSVYGAGDLDSSEPYGLTKAEKASLKNQNIIKQLSLQINSIESSQDEIKQQFEGIKSVFDSDSKNLSSTKNKLSTVVENYKNIETLVQGNSNKINELEQKLDEFIALQKKNNELLQESNLKLNDIVSKINNDYVSKKEFDELVYFVNNKKTKKNVQKVVNNADNNFGFKSNASLYQYAVKMHGKRYLTKTMPMFDKLIKDNYKKASSSYYLADILHFKKRYKDAIHYYKQSMMLNDSASYIPNLLLNSADSFEKLKDYTNARNFYQTLIDAYGETNEAKQAIKRLEKLK